MKYVYNGMENNKDQYVHVAYTLTHTHTNQIGLSIAHLPMQFLIKNAWQELKQTWLNQERNNGNKSQRKYRERRKESIQNGGAKSIPDIYIYTHLVLNMNKNILFKQIIAQHRQTRRNEQKCSQWHLTHKESVLANLFIKCIEVTQ